MKKVFNNCSWDFAYQAKIKIKIVDLLQCQIYMFLIITARILLKLRSKSKKEDFASMPDLHFWGIK